MIPLARLSAGFFPCVLSLDTMTTSFRQFNTASFAGRVADASIPQGRDFGSITLYSTIENDREVTISFTVSGKLMEFIEKGYLMNGRQVIVTGHISDVSQVYTKDGVVKLRKRPDIRLAGVSLELGAKPASARSEAPAAGTTVQIDDTPAVTK